MLKVKDDVDLKELKKFGYYYYGNENRGDRYVKDIDDNVIRAIIIDGDWNGRKIGFKYPYMKIEYPPIKNYIQDLIQAGLVEKVEQPNGEQSK